MKEQRIISIDAELRAAGDRKVEGYAARYNVLSGPIPVSPTESYREKLLPGAFKKAVAERQDVVCLVNHEQDKLLGRTTSGTLQLGEDSKGLSFRCSLPNTQLGRDTHELVQRGDLNGCSFSFSLGPEDGKFDFARADEEADEEEIEDEKDLSEDEKKKRRMYMDDQPAEPDSRHRQYENSVRKKKRGVIRTIRNVSTLYDVSLVVRPAYPRGTSVNARSLEIYPELTVEVRSQFFPQTIKRHVEPATDAEILAVAEAANATGRQQESIRSRRRNLLNSIL